MNTLIAIDAETSTKTAEVVAWLEEQPFLASHEKVLLARLRVLLRSLGCQGAQRPT